MHPEIIRDQPGNCPLCGMKLIETVVAETHGMHSPKEHGSHTGHELHQHRDPEIHSLQEMHEHHDHDAHNGHGQMTFDKHAGHHTADFLKRFWISLGLTVPVLLLSHMVQQWLGISIQFKGSQYLLLALSTIIYFYGGMPFLRGMVSELKANAMGMMTLVAIAITIAFAYSVSVVFGLEGMDFFWELATLIDIMLLGHWLEMKSQMAASKALQTLVELLPADVNIEINGAESRIRLEQLKKDDVVIIRPGEKIPADGTVIDGTSYVNESMLTGESKPVKKQEDAKLIAGSINGEGAMKMVATAVGKDNYLSKVINLVQDAQAAKSNTQNLADKVAKWLTIVAIVIGAGTFIFWFFAEKNLSFALERMVTVMVTACPHALGVAIPLVVAISTARSAANGLLIRNRTAFETTRKLTTIIFDKTGTLTEGSHKVQKLIPLASDFRSEQILQYAAAVQQNSEHHIAHGIMSALKEKNIPLLRSTDFHYMPGMGVSAKVEGKDVVSAGPNYFKEKKIAIPPTPEEIDTASETINYLMIDNKMAGIITLADRIRPGSKKAISELREMGIKSFLLTGDNETIARSVANELGMDGYLANVLPHQKQEKVKEYQDRGEIVAMTGDGVNDAPALAQADVGIAVGSGTDVAAETADIILVNSDPGDVVKMISFGKHTYSKMIQNLIWALGYNVIAIPLAAGILYPSFVLSPALGAVLMSLSTIIVAVNATLLKIRD